MNHKILLNIVKLMPFLTFSIVAIGLYLEWNQSLIDWGYNISIIQLDGVAIPLKFQWYFVSLYLISGICVILWAEELEKIQEEKEISDNIRLFMVDVF